MVSPLVNLILCIGLPLLVAALIAHAVRLPEYTRRIAIVVFPLAICLWALFPLSKAFRLGIDLSGGTILVYQVEQPAPAGFQLDKMVAAIQRRVNPAGIIDATIRGVGSDRVEIIIPRATPDEVKRCKRILTDAGTLEFRILANRRDHLSLIEQAEASFPRPLVKDGKTVARWVPIATEAEGDFSMDGDIAVHKDPERGPLVLVVHDPYNVTGEFLRQASSTFDHQDAGLAVAFRFSAEGGRRFANLTGENTPSSDGFQRRLAIILNGAIQSAPTLRSQIHDQGIITGRFSRQEVDDLAGVLNAGSLPAALIKTPVSELTVGPTLGRDTIQSGLQAMLIATTGVLLFMAVYYRLAGLVADFTVLVNVLLVVGLMALIKASFTLPGLAGLALSIGMAVDANVLIYERLREEAAAGKTLRVTIRDAFQRAFRPIFDSNVTTLATGVILYTIGSEQVKGFALTLIIGLAANLFTAVFVCRLIFDIFERNGWIKRFRMMSVFGQPAFNFVRPRFVAVGASALVIVVGLVGVGLRGADLFDIDFTGGTLAAVHLKQPSDTATLRRLASAALPDVSVEELQIQGEPAGQRFLIRTTLQDSVTVRRQIGETLGDQLTHGHMNWTIPATTDKTVPPAAASSNPPAALAANTLAGGTTVNLRFDEPLSLGTLRADLDSNLRDQGIADPSQQYELLGVQAAQGQSDEFIEIRLTTSLERPTLEIALQAVQKQLAAEPLLERLDNFGGQVAQTAQQQAGLAILISLVAITVYLWIRFQNVLFGLGAVVALLHDVLVVLGLVALSRWVAGSVVGHGLLLDPFKIDLPMIAAFLTLVGYSVNDTIVVFDRIRELRGRLKTISWELINTSVNRTLSRTILTALTTWLVALVLYVFGGQGVHALAFVLVAGVMVGTYSSIYIASPILIWLARTPPQRVRGAEAKASLSHAPLKLDPAAGRLNSTVATLHEARSRRHHHRRGKPRKP